LPSQPEPNPKESTKAITLRNGKGYESPTMPEKKVIDDTQPIMAKSGKSSSDGNLKERKDEGKEEPTGPKVLVQPYKPKIPFPQRLKNNSSDPQFVKFLELFKQLKINVPFVDAIAQMSKYAKFLKEILSNKRKLIEFETIALSEECSAIVLKKLPPKLKDPDNFTIPCTIGDSHFEKALCDLGLVLT